MSADGKAVPAVDANRIDFRAVEESTWADMERLFEAPGAPKYCWCMAWRQTPEEVKQSDNESRKAYLRQRVDAGTPVGLLAYLDGEPAAWCSIAPRSSYNRGLNPKNSEAEKQENVWTIACFFVPRRLRGQGLVAHLIDAAVEEARRQGAAVVEAYPVDPESPSYRHMGFVESFVKAGFEEVGWVGSRRHWMRRKVG